MIILASTMVTLNLHSGIFWTNEFSSARVAEDVFSDVNDGSDVVQRMVISGARDVILDAQGNDSTARSYWKRSQILQIEQWEISGEIIDFTYGSKLLKLRVPANPFSVTPLRDMEGHTDDDFYFGTINFKEVL